MTNRFASGKKAIAECDRCGFRVKLKELKELVVKGKHTNVMVCRVCWEVDHPQLMLGMFPVADPQALRNPRPDSRGYPDSRNISWGWNPVYCPPGTGAVGAVTVTV